MIFFMIKRILIKKKRLSVYKHWKQSLIYIRVKNMSQGIRQVVEELRYHADICVSSVSLDHNYAIKVEDLKNMKDLFMSIFKLKLIYYEDYDASIIAEVIDLELLKKIIYYVSIASSVGISYTGNRMVREEDIESLENIAHESRVFLDKVERDMTKEIPSSTSQIMNSVRFIS